MAFIILALIYFNQSKKKNSIVKHQNSVAERFIENKKIKPEVSKVSINSKPSLSELNENKKNEIKTGQDRVGLRGDEVLDEKILRKYPFLKEGKIVQDVVYDKAGSTGIKSIKIVETDFKYPLIRIVEVEALNKKGEPYTQTEVMVASHILVKLKDEHMAEDFNSYVVSLGGVLSSPREYSRVYKVQFENDDIKTNDRFIEMHEALKKSAYTKTAGADYLVSIY